jgi:hypothetical protein
MSSRRLSVRGVIGVLNVLSFSFPLPAPLTRSCQVTCRALTCMGATMHSQEPRHGIRDGCGTLSLESNIPMSWPRNRYQHAELFNAASMSPTFSPPFRKSNEIIPSQLDCRCFHFSLRIYRFNDSQSVRKIVTSCGDHKKVTLGRSQPRFERSWTASSTFRVITP